MRTTSFLLILTMALAGSLAKAAEPAPSKPATQPATAAKPSHPTSDPISGHLLDVDGKPLGGVKMCLCSRQLNIWSPELPVDDPKNPDGCVFSTTDASGLFSFPQQKKHCNLLVFTDNGYVIAKSKSFTFPLTIRLTPWAKLQGIVKIGDQPAPAGVAVQASYWDKDIADELGPYPHFTATTDEHGHFDFGRVLAGICTVGRTLADGSDGRGISVSVPAGKTSECVISVIGRNVRGQISIPKEIGQQKCYADASIDERIALPQPTLPANVLQMTSDERLTWYNHWETQTAEGQHHATQRKSLTESRQFIRVNPDGSFTASDMTEGTHAVRVLFFPIKDGHTDYEHQLATAAYDFKISAAEGKAQIKPLDLGVLSPRVAEITNADQTVPDIVFRSREGSDLLLSGFRGKVVLLDFWGTWCGVCKYDLPNVKAIFDDYGSNPHFAMISLSAGDERPTWDKFIQENQMKWTQGFLGKFDDAWQAKLFCVSGYPSYWVIGPDGKVLAQGFQSKPLRPIIDKVLNDLK